MKNPALIAPAVLCLALVGLLTVARFYERIPLKAPPCGFRKLTGWPCPACRGTRSFVAISHGRLAHAARLNPLAVSLAAAPFLWLTSVALRGGQSSPSPKHGGRAAGIVALLLLFNWIYLILTQHQFP